MKREAGREIGISKRKLHMSELRFEDILVNAGTDEFGRITGYADMF